MVMISMRRQTALEIAVEQNLSGPELQCLVFTEIDAWHEEPAGQPLHEWLGLTPVEFKGWAEVPSSLEAVVQRARLSQAVVASDEPA